MNIRHELLELARDCDECALEARKINNESRPSGEERAWTAMARRIRHIAKRANGERTTDSPTQEKHLKLALKHGLIV
jgi:hypothetical protein